MPELPEVETIVNQLRKSLVGNLINRVVVSRPQLLNIPVAKFIKSITNQKIISISRRAKLIIIKLENYYLATHLRMTGALILMQQNDRSLINDKKTRIIYYLADHSILYYQDTRALGKIYLLDELQLNNFIANYGVEPLSNKFTIKFLQLALGIKKFTIKQFLLDQQFIVGIGNIYASEILFLAQINPFIPANKISNKAIINLHKCIIKVLVQAIQNQGTTFSDYRDSLGEKGNFQNLLQVYKRYNEECKICGTLIMKEKIQTRSTYYCPKCQN